MTRKHMKLPNGFGQITKLKGRLRNPYRAMITVGHTDEGRPISKILKPQGYFPTYNDAYAALMQNRISPYDQRLEITFGELYEEWKEETFPKYTYSRNHQIEVAYRYISDLADVKIKKIKVKEIKTSLNKEMPFSMKPVCKNILNAVFDIAMENDIVEKNYARIAKIDFEDHAPVHEHIAFTEEEISVIWKNIDDEVCKWVIVQSYTGLRPAELLDITIDNVHIDEHYMVGGKKTSAGKNRIIPIHPAIESVLSNLIDQSSRFDSNKLIVNTHGTEVKYETYRRCFKSMCEDLGIQEHKLHDPRKFFITTAKRSGLDEYALKLIVGHSIKDVTESVYTERSPEWLFNEISKICCMNNV